MASTLPFELELAEISICAHQWPPLALQALAVLEEARILQC